MVAAINADVGGWAVLGSVADDLAAWGLVYVGFGALAGLSQLTRLGPAALIAPWLLALVLADSGIAPRVAYAVPVAVGLAAAVAVRWDTRRVSHGIVGVACIACLACCLVALSDHQPGVARGIAADRPSVLIVVVDTLRRDRVGPLTPEISRLATEGAQFSSAWSTSSWTLPSHASLFTGLSPTDHGATESHPVLPTAHATLAEQLAERGYRTVGLSANAWVSPGTGLDRGFQRFGFHGDDGIASQLLLALVLSRPDDLGGRAITDAAIAEIDAAAATSEPLFLFVNYLEAHEPLGTLPGEDPAPGRAWMRDMPRSWCRCASEGAVVGDLACRDGLYRAEGARIDAVSARYDAGVAYVDARIGELRAALERAGRLDDTLIVVTSDHGEHLGEDGRLGHMVWLTAPLVEIPLIVRLPERFAAGTVDAQPIDLTHVAPLVRAVVDGAALPARSGVARAEIHPHPEALRNRWGTLFGCDFAPAGLERRASFDGRTAAYREGPATTPSTIPLDAATQRALESLGYVR